MSLRIFHIVFITISALLCATCAWWSHAYQVGNIFTAVSALFAVLLPIYGDHFLKKTRKLVL